MANGCVQVLRGWIGGLFAPRLRCVVRARAQLGENPRWSASRQRLYWIDMPSGSVHYYEPASGRSHAAVIAPEIGALLQRPCGSLLVGLPDGLWALSPELLLGRQVAILPRLDAHCRLNDGAVDEAGRIWLATMHREGTADDGGLCRIDPDGRTSWVDRGYRIANGPALGPDGRTLYVADSPRRLIHQLRLDAAGNCCAKRVFARFDEAEGYPDGMAVGPDGCLWVAHYEGGRVSRFSSAGRRLGCLRVPVSKVTACAFGGQGLGTLFVTSARQGLGGREGRRQPLAGGVFAADWQRALPGAVPGRGAGEAQRGR